MTIPEGGVGSRVALDVFDADGAIGEPGLVGLGIKQMVHQIFLSLTDASIPRKNTCLSINTRPIPFTTEVVEYLASAER